MLYRVGGVVGKKLRKSTPLSVDYESLPTVSTVKWPGRHLVQMNSYLVECASADVLSGASRINDIHCQTARS
jgi:hypothetical protein